MENIEMAASLKQGEEPKRFQNRMKQLQFGQFAWKGKEQRSKESWTWLKEGKIKRQIEALIIAAQDQANYMHKLHKNDDWQVSEWSQNFM